MNFVVFKFNVILKNVVPLFQDDFVSFGSGLGCNEFFQIANRVVLVTLDTDFFAEPIVHSNFNHSSMMNTYENDQWSYFPTSMTLKLNLSRKLVHDLQIGQFSQALQGPVLPM